MKRGTSATSRLGLFYSNHPDSSHRSHPQATFVWPTITGGFSLAKVGSSFPRHILHRAAPALQAG